MKALSAHTRFVVVALVFAGALPIATFPARAQEKAPQILTNDDVIKMVQAKLGDGLIAAKIRSSTACKFDTEPATLVKLKQLGVSDPVMQAMMQGCGTPAPSSTPLPPSADPNNPAAPHDAGIYLLSTRADGNSLIQLEPTAYGQTKSGGFLKSTLTSGIAKSNMKAVVRGGRASLRSDAPKPVFYFYFTAKPTLQASPLAAWFAEASSPNQFTLVKFDAKKDSRELIVGEFNNWSSSTGTREKDVVQFDFQKIAPGVYTVTLRDDVSPGEYCFFYTGTAPGYGVQGGQLFDFGVDPRR